MAVNPELKEKFEAWAHEIFALSDGEMFERLVEVAKAGLIVSIKMQKSPASADGLTVEIEMTTSEDEATSGDFLDWKKAESHLIACDEAYKEAINLPGGNPWFALGILTGLRMRFDKGERTKELYSEIMEFEL